MLETIRPSIDPWGTPLDTGLPQDVVSLNPSSQSLIHFTAYPAHTSLVSLGESCGR